MPHSPLPSRPPPTVLAISDRSTLPAGSDLDPWLRSVAAAGVDAVQLREKDLGDRELFELLVLARKRLPPEVLLLVNGRADLALAAGAEGVHLPAASLPVAAVRRLARRLDRPLLVGRSTHHPDEVAAAAREGADYVTFGPAYPTPSKASYGPPPGLSGLRAAVAASSLPVLALGGVTANRAGEVAACGAWGVAAIRELQEPASARDLVEAVRRSFPPRGARRDPR